MTIRIKTATGLPCAYKPCLRRPRTPEMAFIVRGRYRLEPGAALALVRSDDVSPELIEKTREDSPETADDHRSTAQFGSIALLDRRVEGVEVRVDDGP